MNNRDELFQLIKSMNKNEKGYFRKFSGLHGSNGQGDYIRLFDSINRMNVYDEAAIKEEFKGEKILSHLSVTKHYLKNLIIRALRNYNEEHMTSISGHLAIADTFVMMSKGLYKSAGKRIMKERQAAIDGEKFLLSLDWIMLDEYLLASMGRWSEMEARAQRELEERRKITEQFINLQGYAWLKSKLLPLMLKKTGSEELKMLEGLLRHPLLSSNKMPLSNRAREFYTEIIARICHIKKDYKMGRQVLQEMIAHSESPENRNPPKPANKFVLLNLLLNFMGREQAAEMPAVIDKCRKLIAHDNNGLSYAEKNVIQSRIYMHEARMNLSLRKPEAAMQSAHRLEQHYKKTTPPRDDEISVWLLKAVAWHLLKQYDKALVQLNLILNYPVSEQNYQFIAVYLLNIIAHIELGNRAILKRQFTIAFNFVKKNYAHDPNELWILKEMERLAKVIESRDRKSAQAIAANFLKALKSKKIVDKEYLEDWLEGKQI